MGLEDLRCGLLQQLQSMTQMQMASHGPGRAPLYSCVGGDSMC